MIQIKGKMELPLDRRSEVLEALPEHILLTQKEAGCLWFKVHREEGYLIVDEAFEDETAFEYHQERITGTRWETVTKGLQRHYEITKT